MMRRDFGGDAGFHVRQPMPYAILVPMGNQAPHPTGSADRSVWANGLDADVETYLRATNLWWMDEATPPVPLFRRWLFKPTLHRLTRGLTPITVLRGPRQVGKSTLLLQVVHHLLENGVEPRRIFRVQFDELPVFEDRLPILRLALWFEHQILGGSGFGGEFNARAHRGEPVYLLFDEVQNLADWAPQIKSLVDQHAVRVLLTGSSALSIEKGRDSLAGRISTLEMGTLLLREVAALRGFGELGPAMDLNGLGVLKERAFWEELRARGIEHGARRDRAFAAFAERGGFPIAQVRPDEPWDDLADHLNETVIRRVLRHDLGGNDPRILEEVFRLACRYAGQDPGARVFVSEIKARIELDVGWSEILDQLRALDQSLLLRRIPPFELRLKRQGHRHKVCLCDPSLRAAWLREIVPLAPEALRDKPAASRLAGPLAESIVGTLFTSMPGLDVAWHPERGNSEPEIDFMVTVGVQRLPIEVKYRQRIDPRRDLRGLIPFIDKEINQAPFGLLVTLGDGVEVDDPRVVALPLASLLLLR